MKVRDVVIVIVVSTAAAGVFLVAFPMLVWKGEVPIAEVLEFTSILLSWPMAVLILGFSFEVSRRDRYVFKKYQVDEAAGRSRSS